MTDRILILDPLPGLERSLVVTEGEMHVAQQHARPHAAAIHRERGIDVFADFVEA